MQSSSRGRELGSQLAFPSGLQFLLRPRGVSSFPNQVRNPSGLAITRQILPDLHTVSLPLDARQVPVVDEAEACDAPRDLEHSKRPVDHERLECFI